MSIAPPAHTRGPQTSDEWITPRWLVDRLAAVGGAFELGACASVRQPWPCARSAYTVEHDGLARPWFGSVWCNPPYGRATVDWLARCAAHRCGVALVFARTETACWSRWVWGAASCVLFLCGRLAFARPDGTPAGHNSGGPSALVGYGSEGLARLQAVADLGALVELWQWEGEGVKRGRQSGR